MESLKQQIETADNIIIVIEIVAIFLVIICIILAYKTHKIKLPK